MTILGKETIGIYFDTAPEVPCAIYKTDQYKE